MVLVRRARFLTRNLWKLGFVIAGAVLLTSRAGSDAHQLPHLGGKVAAAQSVPCGLLPAGTVTWSAPSYILPISPGNDPFPDAANPPCAGGVVVGPSTTLVIDASANPVRIFSSGAGINVQGGTLETANTDSTHTVSFEAAADVASWDGINITASGNSKGNASLSYISIQGALRSIQISSGATSSPADSHYGLTVSNSGIGFSYFDGIDATDTPISVTGLNDGHTGTINNIGSIGINATFDAGSPAIPADALHIDGMTFGSSAPFGINACPSNQPCYIGNQAVFGSFTPHAQQPVLISHSNFYRAGTYGVQLESANDPVLQNNLFVCNGLGAPTTASPCGGSGPVYSAAYLNQATANLAQNPADSGHVSGNHGFGNGLDAVAFSGTVVPETLNWQNATNAVSDDAKTHWLGYLLTGDLNLANGTLVVGDGGVVKTLGGTINLTNSKLDASTGNPKTFTSLRDPIGIASCPSVFAPSCGPAVLPGGEWGGINLTGGSSANINRANIFYATTGVRIAGGATSAPSTPNYGLSVSGSTIGPTFSDGIFASGTSISVTNTNFQCVASGCQALAAGDHGISADFTGSPALGGGLQVAGNTFFGSVNEAIKGTGLAGQTVDIENNAIDHAGVAGIQLVSADHLTLKQNAITNSGTATPTYPAIYLNGVANADFNTAIAGNTGARNGLDAIAFHGSTGSALSWLTIANSTTSGPLGYLLDGPLTVNGPMVLRTNDYVPTSGPIRVTGGALTATGAVVTSLKDSTVNIPTCGSFFDPRVSSACPRSEPGDWNGFTLDSRFANALSGGEVRYATSAIAMGKPGIPAPLTLNGTSLRNLSADGIATQSSLDVTGGAFTNIAGRAFNVDLTGSGTAGLSIVSASVAGTGREGILAAGLGGDAAHFDTVRIDSTSVDHAGATGIDLVGADHLTLTNNTVTGSAARYPAIYLNGFSGVFSAVSGNKGGGNGLDALVFHGTINDDLTWISARKTAVVKPLGYLLDGDLSLPGTLSVNAGDTVKSSGAFNVGHLKADDTSNASQKVFTSLSDDSVGVQACGSVLLAGCTAPQPGDWGGINLGSDGSLVNGAVRYATTGIQIGNAAGSTFGSSSFGLLVSRSRIDFTKNDAIDTGGTPVSVANSSISGAIHGISADFTTGGNHAALRLSGNRFSNTTGEAILGQALGSHPVWITDNHVQAATTFGVRLVGSDQLVLRNNNVTSSGGGPGAGSARYPAIYLSHASADFSRDVRGNVGNGNGLDAVMMDGTAVGGLSWITPNGTAGTHALGYLLDGALTVQGGSMIVRSGDVVKGRGGPITIKGAILSSAGGTYTSLTDPAGPVSCPSAFVTFCGAAPGDWGGLVVTQDAGGNQSAAHITGGSINYAATALETDNGPTTAITPVVTLSGVAISNISKDGVNSVDTPISVTAGTSITGVGSHGIIASFLSPANCPAGCERFRVSDTHITGAAKDAIVANGLGGQPSLISGNTIAGAGTYGIRLLGADILTAIGNNVTGSGTSAPTHPAIYLSGVSGDFQNSIKGNLGTGNGLDALVFHGVATGGLTWLTPGTLGSTLGYMLDGPLTVDGPFNTTGVVKVLTGGIKVNGVLTSTETAFTSMLEGLAPSACGTIFVPSGCPSSVAVGDYWGGINVDPIATSAFTGGSITDATSGITMASGELDMTGATLTSNSGYAVHTTGTGTAMITCTGIHGNAGGIKSDGGTVAIDNSDLYGNVSGTGKDFDGLSHSSASHVWWNGPGTAGAPDATTQYNPTTVTPDAFLPQQAPTVKAPVLSSVVFTSDNTNSVTKYSGKGTLTVTLKFDRTMNVNKPLTVGFSSTFDHLPHPVTGNWTDKVTWVGNALIGGTDVTGHAGLNTLSVASGASCMRDGTTVMDTETAPFNLDFGTATVDDSAGANHVGATSATLNGTVNAQGWSLASTNPATETYAFVESAPLGTALPDPAIVISGVSNPSTLPGYTVIGHGNASVPISQTVTGLTSNADYHYAFVAVDLNGITLGPLQTFTTTGPVDHYELSSAASSTTAGDPYTFKVTAKDAANKTVDDYTGTVQFALQPSDSQSTPPANYQFRAYTTANPTGDDGVHSFTATLTKAPNQSILATDTLSTIGGTLAVTVSPAAAKQLVMGQQPTNAVAGVAIAPPVTVFVEDPFGNVETGDTGTENKVTMAVASIGPSASLQGTKQQNDVAGIATFNDLNIQTANTGYALHATSGSLTPIDSSGFDIRPAAAANLTLAAPATATAGTAFDVTVTLKDLYGNVATGYTGTAQFSGGGTGAILPGPYTFTSGSGTSFDNGMHTFTGGVTLKQAGSQTITATDSVTTSLTSGAVVAVSAASANSMTLAAPATATAGTAFDVTVTLKDLYGNVATGYTGTAQFSGGGTGAILPGPYTFTSGSGTSFDNGMHTFTGGVTLKEAGSQTITATDSVTTSLTSGAVVAVSAGPLQHLSLIPATSTITLGQSQTYSAEGFDLYENDLGNETSATTFAISPDGTCSAAASCTPTAAGSHAVTGTDGTATGTATLTVNPAPPPAPVVTGIAPTTGPAAGGTSVTITGSNLDGATDVKFGTLSGAIVTDMPTQIIAKSPTSSAGPAVDVTVTTGGGTSAPSAADKFTFVSYSATVTADVPSIYWRLGEATGTTANDVTAAGNNGTYSAGVTLGQPGVLVGDTDTAVTLNGTSGSIQENSGAGAPVGSTHRSLEAWFKTTVATAQPLFNYGTAGPLSQFSVYAGSNQIQVKDGTETLMAATVASLSDGLWHHVVVTYDGATSVSVFVDGAVVGAPQITSGLLATTLDASGLEAGRDSTTFFAGSLDEVAVYGVDLSSSRIAAHYHAGHGD